MLSKADKEAIRKISFHRISFEKEDGKHLIYRCEYNSFIFEKEPADISNSHPIFLEVVSKLKNLGFTVIKKEPKFANCLIRVKHKNIPMLNNKKHICIQECFCFLRDGLAWPAFYKSNLSQTDLPVVFISDSFIDSISDEKLDEFYVHIST